MSPELDTKLCETYPEIFRDRHGSKQATAMCWGFSCGDGWYWLIDHLCSTLMYDVRSERRTIKEIQEKLAESPDEKAKWDEWTKNHYTAEKLAQHEMNLVGALERVPVASQVKEKFGGLRFYVNGSTDESYQKISFAESLSYRICEDCGAMKDVQSYHIGWVRSLCPEHAKECYGDEAEHYRNKTGEWADDVKE